MRVGLFPYIALDDFTIWLFASAYFCFRRYQTANLFPQFTIALLLIRRVCSHPDNCGARKPCAIFRQFLFVSAGPVYAPIYFQAGMADASLFDWERLNG